MRLTHLSLASFRNIASASLDFDGNRHFFLGPNAQGKTNLLEAIAYCATLKSFRTHLKSPLVALGAPQATLRAVWQHEKLREATLGVSLTARTREALLDGKALQNPAELAGVFPIVALSLADRALIYEGPAARRDEIDHLLCQIHPPHAQALADYAEALQSRNRLLAEPSLAPADHAQLDAFEASMAASGTALIRFRARMTELLSAQLPKTFALFAPASETPALTYTPHTPAEALAAAWKQNRAKENAAGHTLAGPQRDSFSLLMNGEPALHYASEGQKFSLVLALKLAGLQLLHERLGIAPVLVADDLLLELDRERQERFWASLGDLQVFASGTTPPANPTGWKIWDVKGGDFCRDRTLRTC